MEKVDLIECPRDAMQGIKSFIPTARKVEYIQMLLNCNFHTLDLGSFVSPHHPIGVLCNKKCKPTMKTVTLKNRL